MLLNSIFGVIMLIKRFIDYSFKGNSRCHDSTLALMHIPKTAGTSIMNDISNALDASADVRGFDPILFGAFQNYSSLKDEALKIIYQNITDMPDHADLVMGHFSLTTLCNRYPHAQRITFLREPISRLLSHWVFWRCQGDETFSAWGEWSDYIKIARKNLKDFLTDARIAPQTDNVAIRMLLWPHQHIGADTFIQRNDDRRLLREALGRLDSFSYSDVIENPAFNDRLAAWLGVEVSKTRLNETPRVPEELRLRLDRELDEETLGLLQERSRLDAQLWLALSKHRLHGRDVELLRHNTMLRGVARYSELLAP
jgi:Sulfotransferase family